MTVLIIEDENLLLKAVSEKFHRNDIETIEYSSGKKGLEYLHKKDTKLPDVIWLDYYLPDVNGMEFMIDLQKNDKLSNIPVVVVSNSASDEHINKMLKLGAERYLLKAEYRLEDLVKIFKDIVNERESAKKN